MKNKPNYQIFAENPLLKRKIVECLLTFPNVSGSGKTRDLEVLMKLLKPYPWIVVAPYQNDESDQPQLQYFLAGNAREVRTPQYLTVSLKKLFSILLTEDKCFRVILNKEYTAELTEDGVVVGCTTFPLDKIDELYKTKLLFEQHSNLKTIK